MKKLIMIATALAVIFPFLVFSQQESYYSGSYTRLSYVNGDVYIQRAQDLGYEKGEVNLVVIAGDKLGTREGRAEIQLGRRNYLRLDRDTLVDMVNLPSRDGDLTKLHLISGSIYVRVNNLDREKNFEIHTPDASFYLMQQGLYRVDVSENKETEFRVYNGSAEAAAEEGSVMVQDGEQVTAANGRFISSPGSLYSRGDDFSDWNASRDAIFARRLTKTYLPEDYSDYEYELSSYGRWAYEAPYGNVWVPTISDYDWRPYYNGRWAWYPIIGWTWVSYEPWGWCTSHYGRWGWRFGLGWYWIPQNHWGWGPAWVHWYHGYDHYGWCALSYYDRPGVILNNRFYDRYDRGYFPGNSRSLVVVHRNQLQSPRLRGAALDQRAVERLGRIQLQASQPNLRPALSRDKAVNSGALKAFSRENLRNVGKGFVSGQRRLDSQEIRPSVQNRIRGSSISGASGASPSKAVTNRDVESFIQERGIRRQDSKLPSQRNEEGVSSGTIKSRKDTQDSSKPMSGSEMKGEIRSFPSRRSSELPSSGSQVRSGDFSQTRAKEFSAPKIEERGSRSSPSIRESQDRSTIRSYPSRKSEGEASSPSSSFRSSGARDERKIEERAITSRSERRESSLNPSESRSFREYQPRSSGSSSSRDDSVGRMIRERSSSTGAPPVQSPPRSTIKERASSERSGSQNGFLSSYESRSSSPSRSYGTPSRSTSSPSRSYSAPTRSYSSSSSPSYSAPTRSYSSPARSYSPSSPSNGAPSRSYSSPSRSSSGPSRSLSAPSRSSSGSSSRSSSGVSRGSSSRSSSSSSSSSGRVRRR